MKKLVALIGLILLLGGLAHGADNMQPGQRGNGFRQLGSDDIGQQGGQRFGPPPEAYQACEGKTEGSAAQFTAPDGEKVTGTCRIADNRLVLRPDKPRQNSRQGRFGPPPEAYKACEGKSAGTSAQVTSPRGDTIKGTCEERDGKMVLVPDNLRRKRSEQPAD